jgi:hypothetical protein
MIQDYYDAFRNQETSSSIIIFFERELSIRRKLGEILSEA